MEFPMWPEWMVVGCFKFLFFVSLGMLAIRRIFAKFDNDGAVKGAAKKGIVNIITRWLK
jgi:hypothetical protein